MAIGLGRACRGQAGRTIGMSVGRWVVVNEQWSELLLILNQANAAKHECKG